MTTWEEIRDEVAGMLADGQPLEDVIGKLEKRKNEMAKANLLKAMDEMKKREQTNEEWFCGLSTKKKAKFFKDISEKCLNCGSAIDYDEIGECPFGRCRTGLNEYEDWLKEKTMMINTVYNEDGEFVREEPFDADVELDKLYPTEQTNDEWRKICSAEEFAEFLFGIAYMCSYCGDEAHSTKEKIQKCHFGKCVCQRQDWEEWLKQPHTNE